MDYKKYCEEAILREPPLTCIPKVYLPCPHKYYKNKVINRATLTHDQHTNLLATPKGFTWDKNTGLATPPKNVMEEDENGEPKNLVRCLDHRYVRDFVTDTWNVMTPKYRRKLERILVKDFNMTKKEAKEFIKEQKLRSAFSQRSHQSRVYLSERHEWVREIADTLADKMTGYVEEMMSARRTPKVRIMAETILGGFGDLTGERCDLNSPKNRIQKMQVFASDRLAVWLSRILGDYEEELCRDILVIPDTDTSDEEDETPKKKDVKDKTKSEETEPDESKSEETKPEESKNEEAEPKKDKTKRAEAKPAEEKPEDEKPADAKPGETKPAEEKPAETKPAARKPAEAKPAAPKPTEAKPAEDKPAEPKPGEAKPAEAKPAASKPAEPKPGEPKPGEAKPAEAKPAEAKPAEAKPAEVKPAEAKPAEAKPAEVKPVPPKAEETKPAEPKPK
ncbi:unnamed protein product [Nezara viridula]|uniref:Uncharacterized protein n=1 Tax=Nezara viridula TaxID=85310 RepID=A0A9P0EGA7_NEZVI|nr:unnamed protein product [Nezara viridula]